MPIKLTKDFSVNDRLKEAAKEIDVSGYELARICDVSEPVIYNAFNHKTEVSVKVISRFLSKYVSIDAKWLLTGEGKMTKPLLADDPMYKVYLEKLEKMEDENQRYKSLLDIVIDKVQKEK